METRTNGKTADAFGESGRMANKWLSDYNSAVMDIFNQQVRLVSGFYNNFLRLFTNEGNNAMKQAGRFPDWMQANNAMMRAFYGNGEKTENQTQAFFSSFSNFVSRFTEANRRVLNAYSESVQESGNLEELREQFNRFMEDQYDASRKIVEVYADSYRKNIEFTTQMNRAMLDNLTGQMNTMVKQSQVFWDEMSRVYKTSPVAEMRNHEEKVSGKRKEGIVIQ